MMKDLEAFKTKILTLLQTTKKSSDSINDTNYKSYDLRGPNPNRDILINVFNKVFNPCYNDITQNIDYKMEDGVRLFTNQYIKLILDYKVKKPLKLSIGNSQNIDYKNVLSPIIYLYIIIIQTLEDQKDDDNGEVRKKLNLQTGATPRSPDVNLFKFYFTYRVIDFITTQGDYINTALENHKFVFLKRSNYFNSEIGACKQSENVASLNPDLDDVVDFTKMKTFEQYQLIHNEESEIDPCTDIVGDTGKIQFEKQDYKVDVTIGSGDNTLVLTERIRRKYLPVMNNLLYGENGIVVGKMKEKFITLIAIKRLEVEGNEAKQKARCDYARESLQFANQISGNIETASGGGNYLKYNKKRKSIKKNKRSNKRKQSRKRKIIRM